MAKLLSIYIKKANRSTEVLTFGKPEELYERDLKGKRP